MTKYFSRSPLGVVHLSFSPHDQKISKTLFHYSGTSFSFTSHSQAQVLHNKGANCTVITFLSTDFAIVPEEKQEVQEVREVTLQDLEARLEASERGI